MTLSNCYVFINEILMSCCSCLWNSGNCNCPSVEES